MFKRSLKFQLWVSTFIILVFTQTITALWLWHESQEQVAILVQTQLSMAQISQQIAHEKWESLLAFVLPSILCLIISLTGVYVWVQRLTQPLECLAEELNQRSTHDLSALTEHDNVSHEVNSIVTSSNRLLQRIALGLDHERQFTADVAHELRTPLAGVRMHLELMQSEKTETITPLIQRIDDLMVLTDQLLQLARASQQYRTEGLSMAEIDLVTDVCAPVREAWEWEHSEPITWIMPEQIMCVASAPLLQVALKNLLHNAYKYGGVFPEITVMLSITSNICTLEVFDHGQGVPARILPQLTENFFRADQIQSGYGVGLSIVKRISDLHRAQLVLENLTQGGLSVRLMLPLTTI